MLNKKFEFEDISITKFGYMTNTDITYREITVPKGFIFDGITSKFPYNILFSNKELYKGIRAALFHDYMCKHKKDYRRKYATNILIELWLQDGLNKYKAFLVKYFVNLYQKYKYNW